MAGRKVFYKLLFSMGHLTLELQNIDAAPRHNTHDLAGFANLVDARAAPFAFRALQHYGVFAHGEVADIKAMMRHSPRTLR